MPDRKNFWESLGGRFSIISLTALIWQPSDYHLFMRMKKWLAMQRFEDDEELKAGVNEWLKSQAADFYDEGFQKLVNRYDKCLNLNGDYMEK